MTLLKRLLSVWCVAVACAASFPLVSHETLAREESPSIAFSKDERTISIRYDKGQWTFYRPVVTPSKFRALGKVLWVGASGDNTNILLEANIIFDNGTRSTDHGIYCPADELTINGNIIFANAGYGIHSYSKPKRQLITRNICMSHKQAGIILAGSSKPFNLAADVH